MILYTMTSMWQHAYNLKDLLLLTLMEFSGIYIIEELLPNTRYTFLHKGHTWQGCNLMCPAGIQDELCKHKRNAS